MKDKKGKNKVIAVSGKGGVGKTLVTTLLIRLLSEQGVGSLLAIDADPDSNLAGSLGVEFEKTIGDIREELKEVKMGAGMDKKKYLESRAFEITVETENFDLLVMGRPEGPGCYCAVNHMLREITDSATNAYQYTIIDTEAGLEHLSRRTTENVDIMLIVTDASKKGIQTAKRIEGLARELDIKFKEIFLILNRITEEGEELIKKNAMLTDLKVIGKIPEDSLVTKYDSEGRPLMELPVTSKAYNAMTEVVGYLV